MMRARDTKVGPRNCVTVLYVVGTSNLISGVENMSNSSLLLYLSIILKYSYFSQLHLQEKTNFLLLTFKILV